MKQEQKIELTLKSDVITGFSYSFCSTLLKKLKKLKDEDKIFNAPWKKVESRQVDYKEGCLSNIAEPVFCYLSEQLFFNYSSTSGLQPAAIEKLINRAEEFLAIFESKQVIKTQPE